MRGKVGSERSPENVYKPFEKERVEGEGKNEPIEKH